MRFYCSWFLEHPGFVAGTVLHEASRTCNTGEKAGKEVTICLRFQADPAIRAESAGNGHYLTVYRLPLEHLSPP